MSSVNLSTNQLKEIAKSLFKEEAAKENVDVKLFPLTFVEYYKSEVFKNNFSLKKPLKTLFNWSNAIATPFRVKRPAAYYHKEKYILILIHSLSLADFASKRLKSYSSLRNVKLSLLNFMLYHEFRHAVQFKNIGGNIDLDYNTLAILFELLTKFIPYHYLSNHDSYFMECDANLYGIKKVEEHFKNNSGLYTEEDKLYIEKRKERYEFDYMNYDFQHFLKSFNMIYRKFRRILNIIPSFKINYEWLEIFYKKTGEFKALSEIIVNSNLRGMDQKVLYSVISSNDFIKGISFDTLEPDELSVMYNALQYSHDVEIEKLLYNKECLKKQVKYIDHKVIVEKNKLILSKIKCYEGKINELKAKLNHTDNVGSIVK